MLRIRYLRLTVSFGITAQVKAISPSLPLRLTHIAASTTRYNSTIKTIFAASDYQNAERFVESQDGNIKYCFSHKNWFIWNEKNWEEDKVKAIIVRIADWLKILATLPQSGDDEEEKNLKKLRKHATKSQSKSRLEATEWLARVLCPMRADWWNSDSRLLNLQNGTYTLLKIEFHFLEKSPFRSPDSPVGYYRNIFLLSE